MQYPLTSLVWRTTRTPLAPICLYLYKQEPIYILICAVSFDELGLTDNKNPFGLISFLHPFIDLLSSGKSVNNNNKNNNNKITLLKKGLRWYNLAKSRLYCSFLLQEEAFHFGSKAWSWVNPWWRKSIPLPGQFDTYSHPVQDRYLIWKMQLC